MTTAFEWQLPLVADASKAVLTTDRYDVLASLMRWVEQSKAPDRIEAASGPGSPWPNRTRPLCAYPAVARYKGSGDIDSAAGFECRK